MYTHNIRTSYMMATYPYHNYSFTIIILMIAPAICKRSYITSPNAIDLFLEYKIVLTLRLDRSCIDDLDDAPRFGTILCFRSLIIMNVYAKVMHTIGVQFSTAHKIIQYVFLAAIPWSHVPSSSNFIGHNSSQNVSSTSNHLLSRK